MADAADQDPANYSWDTVPRWTYLRSRAEKLAAALIRTPMARERPNSTGQFGSHGRRRAGMGDVFWQFRRYEQSDPATAIDWRQSAKTDRLYVRQREETTAQTYWLWCDQSASMDYTSNTGLEPKADHALVLTLAMALFFLERGERVGIIGSGRKSLSTKAAFDRIQDMLKASANTDFTTLPIGPSSGRVILIGDFHEQDKKLAHAARLAQRRGLNGFILQVLDPAELNFPFDGHVAFLDQESAKREDVGRAEAMRAQYIKEMNHWRDKLAAIAHSGGWGYVRHATDHDPLTALRCVTDYIATR